MNFESIAKSIQAMSGIAEIRVREPMKYHTSFRVGGPAAVFVVPDTAEGAVFVLDFCQRNEIPVQVVGSGSNLLFSDQGFDGVVLSMYGSNHEMNVAGNRIVAGAGVPLSRLSRFACAANLCGMAFGGGIPGTLGGAVVMNAGAFGGDMSQVLESVRIWQDGRVIQLNADSLCMGYRYSRLQQMKGVVLDAVLCLKPGDGEKELRQMEDYNRLRREKQPLEYPSAGSTFKRPTNHFAGKLIQDAGLSGYELGGAAVSAKHCGFIINKGCASAQDIYRLCCYVQKIVKKCFDVELELEIKLVGEFS